MSVAAVRDDFAIRVGRFDNLPQSDGVIVKLREKICRDGVLVPILVWSNGEIIDGHTRYRIAEELGMHRGIEFRVIDCTEEEAHHMAFELNADRRQMTREERNQHVVWLRAKGWTQKQVAEAVGITRQRVSQIEPDSSTQETGVLAASPLRPGQRLARSKEQSAQINDEIRRLVGLGSKNSEVAQILGISESAVSGRVLKYRLREEPEASDAGKEIDRAQQVADLASEGHNSRQIAAELGRGREWVRRIAKSNGITIPADRIKGNNRNPVAASEAMTRTVQAIADALYPLTFIDKDALDPEQANEWSRSLAESAKQLRTLIRQINQLAKE